MPKARRNALAVLAVAVVALAVVLLTRGSDQYIVKAELTDAGGLRKDSSVKINGVPAGKVKALNVRKDDTAIATLQIKKGAAPIGQGAKLNVRPTDLLGERYAEILVGDTSKPQPSGSWIRKANTAEPVELDDILSMLDANTSQRLGILINEVGVAMNGRGTDFNKLLGQLPSSLEDTTKLLKQVGDENTAIKSGIRHADSVTNVVNGRKEDLGKLLSQANDTLDVVAQKRDQLGHTIQNAPGALKQLRTTLGTLDTASVQLRPTAKAIQDTTSPLNDTLDAIPQFTDDAKGALSKAVSVSPDISKLATGATPTVRRIEPTAKNLNGLLVPTSPILSQLSRRGFDDLLFGINNFNLGLRGRDAIGHFIGAKLNISSEYIDSALENFTNVGDVNENPTPSATKAEPKKSDAAPSAAPDVAKAVGDATKPLKQPLDDVQKTVDQAKKALDGIVGATPVPQAADDVGKAVGGVVGGVTQGLTGGQDGSSAKEGSSGQSDSLRLFDYLMGQ